MNETNVVALPTEEIIITPSSDGLEGAGAAGDDGRAESAEKQECIEFVNAIKNHFEENFPFLSDEARETYCAKFDALFEEPEFESASINLDDLIKRLRQIIVTLDNSHVSLSEKNVMRFELDKKLYYKAGTFWVDVDGELLEIVSVNNVPIGTLVDEKIKETGGGTMEWKKYKAITELVGSKTEYVAKIVAKNVDGEMLEVDSMFLKKESRFSVKNESGDDIIYKKEDYVESKILDKDIGYISINSWGGEINVGGKNIVELVEKELEKIKQCTSVIFDVRDNDGGSSHCARLVASHFIKERTRCCTFLVKKPEQKEMIKEDGYISPEGEFYNQKVVILTSPKCISSTDMFLTFLKDTGRAISIGQTTGGGSGNPQFIALNLGGREFSLGVSCWRNYRNNGQEIENNGIGPDIYVMPTPDDVRAHKDVELETAVAYLSNNKI